MPVLTGGVSSRVVVGGGGGGAPRLARSGRASTPARGRPAPGWGDASGAGSAAVPPGGDAPQRRAAAPRPRGSFWTSRTVGDGWVEHVHHPRGVSVQKQGGSFTLSGMHCVVEGLGPSPYIVTHDPPAHAARAVDGGHFNLQVQIKCARPRDPGPEPCLCFHLVLAAAAGPLASDAVAAAAAGSRTLPTLPHLRVTGDTMRRQWAIDHVTDAGVRRLAAREDAALRPNVFFSVFVQARGDHLHVDCNGVPVVSNLHVPPLADAATAAAAEWGRPPTRRGGAGCTATLAGRVGVAALRDKVIFKDWAEFPCADGVIDASPPSPPPQDRRWRGPHGDDGGGGGGGDAAIGGEGGVWWSDRLRQSTSDGWGQVWAASDPRHLPGQAPQQQQQQHQQQQQASGSMRAPSSTPLRMRAGARAEGAGLASSTGTQAGGAGRHLAHHRPRAAPSSTTSTGPVVGGGGSGGGSAAGPPLSSAERLALRPYRGDSPHLVQLIERDIVDRALGVTFEDVAALHDAKRLLNEAVVLPLLVPEFFTGIREPWRGVLLFGPPGTGKTLLARAVAGMNDTVFFNCSASTLVSKWRGESERLLRCLFDMARHHAPSIVFIDEVDALASSRGLAEGAGGEHEASRRFRAELLSQMDGLTSREGDRRVMVLATTNAPWDLDEALRRRLEKRIYIPLPDESARLSMFNLNTRGVYVADDVDLRALAAATEGYSGADLHVLCREASMQPMRRMLADRTPQEIVAMREAGALRTPPVLMSDFEEALRRTQPSVAPADLGRYARWMREFGST